MLTQHEVVKVVTPAHEDKIEPSDTETGTAALGQARL